MNKTEEDFQNRISKGVAGIENIVCYNFDQTGIDRYFSGEDNGFFLLQTEEDFSCIRLKHNISSNRPDLRFKMYYARQPELDFCEENSKELGFLSGEDYEEIIPLEGCFHSFRFDFGFAPIEFSIRCFELSCPSRRELAEMRRKRRMERMETMGWKLKKLSNLFPYLAENGFRKTYVHAKEVLAWNTKNGEPEKTTQQVVEPYRVCIKEKLEPNRKRVLHFIENFYTGGSSRLIIDMMEAFGHKYDHKILTMAYRGEDEFLDIDVETVEIENTQDILGRIEQFDPDIIHVHIWEGEWYHKVFSVLDHVSGRVIVENINTPIAPITRDYIRKYVFVSHYVVEQFYHGGDDRSQVIYPGSNFEMFTRKTGQDGYLPKDTIGMVYRLGYDKLNRNSIDVFIRTIQKRPQTTAIIVGGGPQYEYYVEKVKKAGVFNNFRFTGYVPYTDLPDWYKKFTIFVAPVWQESFGQVSPFAMSMGMPVTGYRVGALNEIINNQELLAKAEDAEELSDILTQMLDDYDRCMEVGRSNQKRAQSLFGVQKMVDDYFALYEELTQ